MVVVAFAQLQGNVCPFPSSSVMQIALDIVELIIPSQIAAPCVKIGCDRFE